MRGLGGTVPADTDPVRQLLIPTSAGRLEEDPRGVLPLPRPVDMKRVHIGVVGVDRSFGPTVAREVAAQVRCIIDFGSGAVDMTSPRRSSRSLQGR